MVNLSPGRWKEALSGRIPHTQPPCLNRLIPNVVLLFGVRRPLQQKQALGIAAKLRNSRLEMRIYLVRCPQFENLGAPRCILRPTYRPGLLPAGGQTP